MTGPWWGWDPNGGPVASDNGDNTWTVTLSNDGSENMQYLWVVDGVQENLIDNAAGAECTNLIDSGNLITDYSAWANRVWITTDGNTDVVYDDCSTITNNNVTFSNGVDPIESLMLYPNPVVDRINISAATSIDQVRVFDLVGRMVKQATPSSNDFSIDVADLNKGVYMVQLKAGNKETTLKIVK